MHGVAADGGGGPAGAGSRPLSIGDPLRTSLWVDSLLEGVMKVAVQRERAQGGRDGEEDGSDDRDVLGRCQRRQGGSEEGEKDVSLSAPPFNSTRKRITQGGRDQHDEGQNATRMIMEKLVHHSRPDRKSSPSPPPSAITFARLCANSSVGLALFQDDLILSQPFFTINSEGSTHRMGLLYLVLLV